MEQAKVYVSFFLDASRPNSDNTCLIKLNIYQKPHKKRYGTEFHCTKEDWVKLNSAKLRDDSLKELKKKLSALQSKVEEVIKTLNPFSFLAFEEEFFNGGASEKNRTQTRMLADWFNVAIKEFKANDQVGTAGTYQTTINSIASFKNNLQIQDITPAFLTSYEKHLLSENKSLTTINIYMRNLRAIINAAIKQKSLSKDNYPFAQYEIPTGQNVKKALKDFDINLLLQYKPEKDDHKKALDFWLFSYLCSGINFADIISLKPNNINGSYLIYHRQKTIRTKKKDLRPIKVGLNSRAIEILERWKTADANNPYLFPVLETGLAAKTIKNRCQRFIKWVNKRMYEICEALGIQQKTGTYAARHTFSTVLKRKGAPIAFIKDSLGHSSMLVTENYLGSFEDEVALEYANELTNFGTPKLKAV